MKQIDAAANRGVSKLPNPIDVEFEFKRSNGEVVDMKAHAPTTGQLGKYFMSQRTGNWIEGLFKILRSVLDDEHWEIIDEELDEGIDLIVLSDMLREMLEVWTARPTTSSNGSSSSRTRTGGRSTVARRTAASTS